MWVQETKLCIDCEWLFDGKDQKSCPRCAGTNWILLERVVPSLKYDVVFRHLKDVPVQLSLFPNYVRSNGFVRDVGFPM